MAENSNIYARKDDLFRLIKSLNRAEKRFCRTQATTSGGKNARNLRLFDALDTLATYDESAFLESRKGAVFKSNFSYTKNYLFNYLLKSLSVYHAEHSASARLRGLIQQVEILFHKRLFEAARGRIQRGLQLSTTCDLPAYRYLLLQWELKIHKTAAKPDEKFEHRLNLYSRMLDAIDSAKGYERYREITDQMVFNMRRTGQFRTEDDIAPLRKLLKDPRLADIKNAKTAEEKVSFYFSHATFANCMGDMRMAAEYLDEVLYWMEASSDHVQDQLGEYVMRCNNFFIAWHRIGDWEKSESMLRKLRQLKVDKYTLDADSVSAHLWRVLYFNELELYWKTGRFKEAIKLVPEIQKGFQSYEYFLTATNRLSFYFIIACHYFGNGQRKESLLWLNKYFAEEENCMRVDKHGHARLFALILHFELENRDSLPYFSLSTYRYLKKQELLHGMEKLFLHYLKNRFIRVSSRTERHQAFVDMHADFEEILRDPLEWNALRYFDFMAWLKSHVEKRSFAEVMGERVLFPVI